MSTKENFPFEIESCGLAEKDALDKDIWRFINLGIKGIASGLRKTSHESPNFWRMFAIFTMVAICAPSSSGKPKLEWLHLVVEANGFKTWNFAKFIPNDTIRTIAEFKSESNPTTLGGCPLLLMVTFNLVFLL